MPWKKPPNCSYRASDGGVPRQKPAYNLLIVSLTPKQRAESNEHALQSQKETFSKSVGEPGKNQKIGDPSESCSSKGWDRKPARREAVQLRRPEVFNAHHHERGVLV